jgi:hypothetical protein
MRTPIHIWLVCLISLVVGCATSAPPAPEPPPKPSTLAISAKLELNLPPQMALETGLPATVNASLQADAHSELISTAPLHSRHQGTMTLVITDASGKQTFANLNIHISGESDGSPDEGLTKAMQHFFDAASLMSKPIPTTAGTPNK